MTSQGSLTRFRGMRLDPVYSTDPSPPGPINATFEKLEDETIVRIPSLFPSAAARNTEDPCYYDPDPKDPNVSFGIYIIARPLLCCVEGVK